MENKLVKYIYICVQVEYYVVPSGNEIVPNAMSSFDKYLHAMIQMLQMGKIILTYILQLL